MEGWSEGVRGWSQGTPVEGLVDGREVRTRVPDEDHLELVLSVNEVRP